MFSTERRKSIPWHGISPTCLIIMWLQRVTEGLLVSRGARSTRIAIEVEHSSTLAMMRDENKIVMAGRHVAGKPKIDVYTAAGYPIVTLTVRPARNSRSPSHR